jgi:hypothetical protein
MDTSLISTSTTTSSEEEEEEIGFTERRESHIDLESSSATFDDNNSVNTAVMDNTNGFNGETQHYSFTSQGFNRLKDRVNNKIMQVASYANDDYRLIKRYA